MYPLASQRELDAPPSQDQGKAVSKRVMTDTDGEKADLGMARRVAALHRLLLPIRPALSVPR